MKLRTSDKKVGFLSGETVDISRTGMRVQLSPDMTQLPAKGAEVLVKLEHPDFKRPLELPGRVTWLKKKEGAAEVGVQFPKKLTNDLAMYEAWLSRVEYYSEVLS